MTSQGPAYGRLRRALDRGNVLEALSPAAELQHVSLLDALALLLLLARKDMAIFQRAVLRWHARYCPFLISIGLQRPCRSIARRSTWPPGSRTCRLTIRRPSATSEGSSSTQSAKCVSSEIAGLAHLAALPLVVRSARQDREIANRNPARRDYHAKRCRWRGIRSATGFALANYGLRRFPEGRPAGFLDGER